VCGNVCDKGRVFGERGGQGYMWEGWRGEGEGGGWGGWCEGWGGEGGGREKGRREGGSGMRQGGSQEAGRGKRLEKGEEMNSNTICTPHKYHPLSLHEEVLQVGHQVLPGYKRVLPGSDGRKTVNRKADVHQMTNTSILSANQENRYRDMHPLTMYCTQCT